MLINHFRKVKYWGKKYFKSSTESVWVSSSSLDMFLLSNVNFQNFIYSERLPSGQRSKFTRWALCIQVCVGIPWATDPKMQHKDIYYIYNIQEGHIHPPNQTLQVCLWHTLVFSEPNKHPAAAACASLTKPRCGRVPGLAFRLLIFPSHVSPTPSVITAEVTCALHLQTGAGQHP